MFHTRIMNNKINHLHERCLGLLYVEKTSSFEKLLKQEKSVSILWRNLKMLVTKMFKVCRNESPPIFEETFLRSVINYNLRSNSEFAVPNVRSVFLGSESNSYLYPKIWDVVPLKLEEWNFFWCHQQKY